jgi:transmembrane sensor
MGGEAEPTAAEQAASAWIVLLESPDATPADRQRFQEWRSADPANQAAHAEVRRTRDLFHKARSRRQPPPRTRPAWPAPALRALAVAALALIAFLVAQNTLLLAPPAREIAYATGTGEHKTITLPDGSTMELDAATQALVLFGPKERRVTLASGAALFNVRRDPNRPFIVQTPHGELRALGTSFAVRVGETGVRATVLRGSVQGKAPAARRGAGGHRRSAADADLVAIAHANEEISMGASKLSVVAVPQQAMARRLAWREGMLSASSEPLRDAAAEVTRHSGVKFEFADPAIGDRRIAVHLPAGDADSFARHLERALNLRAERVAPDHIRLSDGSPREQ